MMLETVGRSREALSSYKIKKAMKGIGDAYVYNMIEELAPTRENAGKYLFSWDDLPGNLPILRKLFDKLDRIYDLNWLDRPFRDEELKDFKFEKSEDDKLLTISYASNEIGFGLTERERESDVAHMIIHSGEKRIRQSLVTQRKSGKLYLYLPDYTPNPIRYLDITISERGERLISAVKDEIREPDLREIELKTSPEVLKIKNDRQYWKYSLNIRGFILYLLGLIQSKTDKRRGKKNEHQEKQRGRKKADISYNRRRIDKTLEVLSDNHLKDFPFLLYYRSFRDVLPRNFMMEILQQIVEELQYQLDTADSGFLKYWVTRRYYDAITNYFGALERISTYIYMTNMDVQIRMKLKNFRIRMLSKIVNYLSTEEQDRKKALESYRTSY